MLESGTLGGFRPLERRDHPSLKNSFVQPLRSFFFFFFFFFFFLMEENWAQRATSLSFLFFLFFFFSFLFIFETIFLLGFYSRMKRRALL